MAPTIKKFFLTLIPSISVKSWLKTLSAGSPLPPFPEFLLIHIDSNSSKNKTHVDLGLDLALSNISQTFSLDSPNYIYDNSGLFTEI